MFKELLNIQKSFMNKTCFYSVIIFYLFLLNSTFLHSQNPAQIVDKLSKVTWSKKYIEFQKTDSEKLAILQFLLKEGERIEFVDSFNSNDVTKNYYKLSLYGVLFIDLDFDGDWDLLYHGRDGSLNQTGTKIYYNNDGKLDYYSTLPDGIIDIKQSEKSIEVYTMFHPCCGSFTTIISQYNFSKNEKAVFKESISMMGTTFYHFMGLPDFSQLENQTIPKNTALYVFQKTIGSSYIQNKKIKDDLRNNGYYELLKLSEKTKVKIISEKTHKNLQYVLIITEPLDNFPNTLFEKTSGENNRFIAWVKKDSFN